MWRTDENQRVRMQETMALFFRLIRQAQAPLIGMVLLLVTCGRLVAVEPKVVSGYDFSAYLAADGTVWTWGANASGQLGDGTTTQRTTPARVPGLTRVMDIAAGYYHVVAVLSDGTVRTWGHNTFGQIGNGTNTNQLSPVAIGLSNIKAAGAGGYFSLVLAADGTIRSWGNNGAGQLGNGSAGGNQTSPVTVSGAVRYRAIAGGGDHTLAIAQSGAIYAWGADGQGQLGDDVALANKSVPTLVAGSITNAVSIAAGWNHSIAGLADGSIRTWGWNDVYQTGYSVDTSNRTTPYQPTGIAATRVFAGYKHSGYLRVDGLIYTWGANSNGQCHQPVSPSVTSVFNSVYKPHNHRVTGSSLGNHTLYIAEDGTVRGWGNNGNGQLGNGITAGIQPTEVTALTTWSLDAITMIDAGYTHSIALKADGTVWAWGSDSSGELGDDIMQQNKSTPVQVAGLSGIVAIAAGSYHNLALTSTGSVWAWGRDDYGQLGDDATLANKFTPVQVPGAIYSRAIAAGGYHSLAVFYTGSAFGWGANFAGQVGNGTVVSPQPTPVAVVSLDNVVQMDGGWQHTVARRADGTVRTWGQGSGGQLGNGGTALSSSPVTPSLTNVVSIAAGEQHTAANTADGGMYSWGSDGFGQLGDDVTLTTRLTPTFVSNSPSRKQVAVGGDFARHTLILQGNGTVAAVGSDSAGQLGDNSTLANQPTPETVAGLSDIVQVAAGDFHSLALRHDGVVWSWGQSASGQLGNGTTSPNQPTAVLVQATWLPTVSYNLAASLPNASEPSVDGTVAFTRTLVNAGTVPVAYTVSGTATGSTDYQSLPNPRILNIPGNAATAVVLIDPIDNLVAADPKTVTLSLDPAAAYLLGSPTIGTVTIADNDVEGIVVSSTGFGAPVAISSIVTNENPAASDYSVTFYVRFTSQPTFNVTIPFSSSNTNEGVVNVASRTFTPVNWNVYQPVTVSGVNDFLVDGDIPYTVVIGQAISTDARYAALNPPDIPATNRDDDVAGVTIDTSTLTGITETPGTGASTTYRLRLNTQPPLGNNVTITLTPNAQVNVSPSSLTFTNGDWNNNQIVTITAIDDAVAEGPHTGTVQHSASGGGYTGIAIPNVTANITDNDAAGYAFVRNTASNGAAPSRLITTESGGQGVFTIRLTSQPTANVSIPLTSSNTAEGTVSPASVLFTSATWNTPQTITVTGIDDPVDDGDKNYQITFGTPTSGDSNYSGPTKIPAPMPMVNLNNDNAGLKVDPTSIVTSETGGGTATGMGTSETFNVKLNCQPTGNVTVTISGALAAEHTISPGVLNFTTVNWSTPQVVMVTGVNDAVIDNPVPPTYDITVATSAGATEYSGKSALVSLRNEDDDSSGVLVTPSVLTVTEAGGTNQAKTFGVRLNTAPAATVTINLASSNPAAATISPNVLTFTGAPGSWDVVQNVTVVAVNDDIDQASDKTATITATSSSGDGNYNALVIPSVAVTVTDNDTAALVLGSTVLLTTEAGGSAALSVRLASEPIANVTVTVTGLDINEGQLSTATLNFTASTWSTPQNLIITGVNDDFDDGDVSYTLTLTASGAGSTYAGLSGTVIIINRDDDSAGIELLDATGTTPLTGTLETSEVGGMAQFSVRLSSRPLSDVTIPLVSSNTAEGVVSPSSLTFTSANWNNPLAHVVTITGQSDVQDDGDVLYAIITEAAASSDPLYNGRNPSDVAVVNRDNVAVNRAGVTVTPTTLTVTEADGPEHAATFTVVLNSQPQSNVTIFLASNDTSEGTVSPAVLTFTSSTWNMAQTVTVTGVDDLIADGPQPFLITTTAASGDAKYNLGSSGVSDVSVTTTSLEDVPLLVVTPTSLITSETPGGDQNRSFSISLATQPTVPVTVTLAITPGSANGTEGTLSATALTFNANTWFVPQFVTVSGVDDSRNDGDQMYDIILTASGGEYDAVTESVQVTNLDDDEPGVTVAPASGLLTSEAGGTATFTVRLTSQPTNDVTITVLSSNEDEGVTDVDTLVFTSADWNLAQAVTITGVDDEAFDGNVIYQIILTAVSDDSDYDGISIVQVNVTNEDDDTTNLPPIAQARTYATVVNLDIEDVLVGSDPEGTAVTYELGALPSQGTLTLLDATTGAFRFVVPINTRGDYTFTFRVQDATGKLSSYATVTLHITGGDDPRPQVLIPLPVETENGPQTFVVRVAPETKAGTTPFSYKVIGLPAGVTASVQPLSSLTSFQVDYEITTGADGDHFSFSILIIDHDRPAAMLLPVMIQRVTPLGPG